MKPRVVTNYVPQQVCETSYKAETVTRQRPVEFTKYVEQIVMVTDEGENNQPSFVVELGKYREALSADPSVCIVRTSASL